MPKYYEFTVKYEHREDKHEKIKAASHLLAAYQFIKEEEPDDDERLEVISKKDYEDESIIKVWSVQEILKKIENVKKRGHFYQPKKTYKSIRDAKRKDKKVKEARNKPKLINKTQKKENNSIQLKNQSDLEKQLIASAPYVGFSYGRKNEICPKCFSSRIVINKKGFSLGKGLLGAVLTGGIGIVAGFHGKNNLYITCLKCGHKWNV